MNAADVLRWVEQADPPRDKRVVVRTLAQGRPVKVCWVGERWEMSPDTW